MSTRPELDIVVETDPGWIPARIIFEASPPQVEWWFIGPRRFTEPFSVETLDRSVRERPLYQQLRFRTSFEAVERWADASPGMEPAGFILHLSRCGSTVLSRALASDPGNRVLSEPWIVGNVLAAGHYLGLGAAAQANLLRQIMSVLGRPLPGETRLFVKFNAWATRFLPMLRRLYPNTPWVFMFREPLEVLASHVADQAVFMLPDFPPPILGLEPQDLPREDHMARVLSAIARSVLDILPEDPGRMRLIDYGELPSVLLDAVYPLFGLPRPAEDDANLKEVLARHAKHPDRKFEADRESKRQAASEALRQAAERWVDPLYGALIEARDRRRTALPSPGEGRRTPRSEDGGGAELGPVSPPP